MTPALPPAADARAAFVDGRDAHLALSPGLCVRRLNAGLALQITPQALMPGQVRRIMARRFEQPLAFDGCFVYLDADGALVMWQALPAPARVEDGISRLLSLAGLAALDAGTPY
ncbi:transcriptional regulator [Pseudomonas sp. SDO528_S397]